jgi:3-mercaptopyruvate sulfurtransferase SseA
VFDRKLLSSVSLFIVAVILIAGSVWWSLKVERASPARSSLATPTSSSSVNLNSSIPYPEIPRVSLETAKAAFDTKRAVFVDARSASSYSEGHIPGALLMNEEDLNGFKEDLDLSTWIITYCT